MSRDNRSLLAAAALALMTPVIAAGCGGGSDNGGGGFSEECPAGLVDAAEAPVEVTFWHAMTAANRDTLEAMVADFNASQDKVDVQAVFQGSYNDNMTKYFTALRGGDLPDIVQAEDTALQRLIDSQSVVRAQDCIDQEAYDLSDHIDRVVAFYSVNGELWPWPFNVSNPVIYYNRTAFERAGLDPDQPPRTLDEVRRASQTLVDAGVVRHGIALEVGGWFFEQWLAKANQPFVNQDNGRSGRATEVLFDNETGRELFRWIDSMVDDGLAVSVGRNPSGADALLAIGSGDAAMTIGTSAAMRSVIGVLESGQFPDVTVGVGFMPGLEEVDSGGIEVGGAANYLVNRSSPVKQEAARIFAQWLNEPEQQARWHIGSGYVPIRESAAALPEVQELWTEMPYFRVAYDQLLTGETTIASSGSVIGPYEEVREAIVIAIEEMLLQGADPDTALREAAETANAAIEDYNSRIGE